MKLMTLVSAIALGTLAACTGGGGIPAQGDGPYRIVTPSGAGLLPELGGYHRNVLWNVPGTTVGNRWSFNASETDGTMVSQAGVVLVTPLSAPTSIGTATYRGDMQIDVLTGITGTGSNTDYTLYTPMGTVSLEANFEDDTLVGAGTLRDSNTSRVFTWDIHGEFDGNMLGGEMWIDDVPGIIGGQIGQDRALVAVAGGDGGTAYAGGLQLYRQ